MINLKEVVEKGTINKILNGFKTIYGNEVDHIFNNGYNCYIKMDTYEIVIGLAEILRYLLDIPVIPLNYLDNKKDVYYLSDNLELQYSENILNTRLKSDKEILSKYLSPMIQALFLHELAHKKHSLFEPMKTFCCGMSRLIISECIKSNKVDKEKIESLEVFIQIYFHKFSNGIEDGRIEYLEKKESKSKSNFFNFLRSYWKKYNVPEIKENESIEQILNNISILFCYIATIGKIPLNVKNVKFYKTITEKYYTVIRKSVIEESHSKSLIALTKFIKSDIAFWTDLFSDLSKQISINKDESIQKAKDIFNILPYQGQEYIPRKDECDKNREQELKNLFPSQDEVNKNKEIYIAQDDFNNKEESNNIQNDSNDNKESNNIQNDSNNKEESNNIQNDSNNKEESNNTQDNFNNKKKKNNCIRESYLDSNIAGYLGDSIKVIESFIKKKPLPFDKSLDFIKPIKKERKRIQNKSKGKLDSTKLVDLITKHSDRIFSSYEGKDTNICIEILIDRSGSMLDEVKENISKIDQAILSCEIAEKIAMYVPLQITYFNDDYTLQLDSNGNYYKEPYIHLVIIKEFDEKSKNSFVQGCRLDADMNNCDGIAIRTCVNHLKKRNERKKFLIVISDGIPTGIAYNYNYNIGVQDTKNAVEYALKSGITVIPIAILNKEDAVTLKKNYEFMYGNTIICNPKILQDVLKNILNKLC